MLLKPNQRWCAALIVAGAIVGGVLSPSFQTWFGADENATAATLLMLLAGGGAGYLLYVAYMHWTGCATLWHVDSASVVLPVLGTVRLTIDRRQRESGWRVFVELSTRIATQPLERESGSLKVALRSLYDTFQALRDELKRVPPPRARPGVEEADVEAFILEVLNHALRPCLSRWHPRLEAWEGTGLPEARWPLNDACRDDLDVTRHKILTYARALGRTLGIAQLDKLLPADEAAAAEPKLQSEDALNDLEAGLLHAQGAARLHTGWLIYVELSTRVATQRLPSDGGLISETLESLHATFEHLRERLAELPGPTPGATAAQSIEGLTMALLNEDLRPFLAAWHPRFDAWRAQNPDTPESKWPDEAACRSALAAMQDGARARTAALGRLLGTA